MANNTKTFFKPIVRNFLTIFISIFMFMGRFFKLGLMAFAILFFQLIGFQNCSRGFEVENQDQIQIQTSTQSSSFDILPPSIDSFTVPSTVKVSSTFAISIIASDNVGVTGFYLSEMASNPLANAIGWQAAAPVNYNFNSQGVKTLYLWVKDAAGNISAAKNASVIVNTNLSVGDSILPVITSFTIPPTAESLSIAGIVISASDNVGVTGFYLSEMASNPLANAIGWQAAAPVNYNFNSQGVKTLYLWVKDAAGNISAAKNASVAITLPPPPQEEKEEIKKVWIEKNDGSLAQYPGGARSLSQDQSSLMNQGLTIYNSAKCLGASTITLPIAFSDSLTSSQNPQTDFLSGVKNCFEISEKDFSKAQALGFVLRAASTLSAQDCGGADVFLAFGQSNSANSGSSADTTTSPGVLMFYNGYCFLARDPLLGASIFDGGGSIWMPLAKKYIADNPGKKVVIAAFGVGGSSSKDWTSTGKWNSRLTTVLDQINTAGLTVLKVFWHQGETDNQDGVTRDQYVLNFENTLNTIRTHGISAPVSLAIASALSFMPYNISRNVQEAQIKLVEKNYPAVELGVNTDHLHPSYRSSGPHFNLAGLAATANSWYQAALSSSKLTFEMQMIQTYYQIVFQHNGSSSDYTHWINQEKITGGSWSQVLEDLKNSDEGFIRNLYIKYAKRMPERSGYEYWKLQLSSTPRSTLESNFSYAVSQAVMGAYDTTLFYKEDGMLKPRADKFHYDTNTGFWESN